MQKITDGTGFIQLRLSFFSNPQVQSFKNGLKIRMYGVVRNTGNKLEIFHPSYKLFSTDRRPPLDNTLTPIYSVGSSKITQYRLRNIIKNCLEKIKNKSSLESKIDEVFIEKKFQTYLLKRL